MSSAIIKASATQVWREALKTFHRVDVCQMPEYHVAYSTRTKNSRPLLWTYTLGQNRFSYPFLLTPVKIDGQDTSYFDISSIYGYSGPLSTTDDRGFLNAAWAKFDDWAAENKIIAEFTRFSIYAGTYAFAHKNTLVEANRQAAVSHLPQTEAEFMAALDSKTRNMIRKAQKSGLTARRLDPRNDIPAFRALYDETMERNQSPEFFSYDDAYYEQLLSLPENELQLFGVFQDERMIAASIALVYRRGALYHLGASLAEFSSLGANNLSLFEMSTNLIRQNVEFLNLGGGRTTAETDPLFSFKRKNSTHLETFHIGKRVVDPQAYRALTQRWEDLHKTKVDSTKLIFYR